MPPPRGHYAVIGVRRPSVCLSVRLSDVAYIGSNSKTKRPRKMKLCTGVLQVTCDSHTDFKVKRSKVKVGRGILWRRPSRTTCLYMLSHCYNNSSTNQLFLDVTRFSAKFGKTPFNYLASTVCNGLSLNIRLSPCNSSLISEPRSDRSPVKCHVKFCIYKKISYRREAA